MKITKIIISFMTTMLIISSGVTTCHGAAAGYYKKPMSVRTKTLVASNFTPLVTIIPNKKGTLDPNNHHWITVHFGNLVVFFTNIEPIDTDTYTGDYKSKKGYIYTWTNSNPTSLQCGAGNYIAYFCEDQGIHGSSMITVTVSGRTYYSTNYATVVGLP
jgi:hypothetical protein